MGRSGIGLGLCLAVFSVGCGLSTSDAEPTRSEPRSEFFIEGRVDGKLLRIDTQVQAFWWEGIKPGYLSVHALSEESAWLISIWNEDGFDRCAPTFITLARFADDRDIYYMNDPYGEQQLHCSLFVERAAPNVGDVVEGTFSGELMRADAFPTILVTQGAFRAQRIEDGSPY